MTAPLVLAHHARTGIWALNVVTAALDRLDVEVRFARDRDALAAEVRAHPDRPLLVAWSFYSLDLEPSAADLAWVRAHASHPQAIHVAGGVHASAEPRQTLASGFDMVAIGEGETTMVELVNALGEGRDPREVRGTAHLRGSERGEMELVTAGPGDRRPLDDYPAFNVRHGKWNPIEITRGCIYACSFCQTPFLFKARFRHRSVASVREHVQAMVDYGGPRYVRFLSPTALSYGSDGPEPCLPAVEELLARTREVLGARGRIYFGTFPSELRPEHVTTEALAIMARYCDNRSLQIGGQSGSERMLDAMHRGHGVDDIVRAVELVVRAGFRPDVDLLLGMPGERPDERQASLRLAEKLIALGARIHSHAYMPLPGTPLRDTPPEPIEEPIKQHMGRLEAGGAVWGQWRHQLVRAEELVRRRADR